MANQFLTPDFMDQAAGTAAAVLSANTVAYRLTSHQVEQRFVNDKTGGTVNVKYQPSLTANLVSHATSSKALTVTDATEQSVEVDATTHIYQFMKLDSREKTFLMDNFDRLYTIPAMKSIAEQLDAFILRRLAGAAIRASRITGTTGSAPSTVAHLINARKAIKDLKVPIEGGLVAVLGTTAEASFLQLDNFANSDYGTDGPVAIKSARLAGRYGLDFYIDQQVGDFPQGDTAGTVVANGAASPGATSVTIDGFTDTSGNGLVHEGTEFKVAGDTNAYFVTKDAEINTSGEVTLQITPAVITGWADAAAVTFQTVPTMDMIWHPGMMAAAAVAPQPLMENSRVGSFEGFSVRISFQSVLNDATSGPSDFVLFDVYAGAKAIRTEGVRIVQGS